MTSIAKQIAAKEAEIAARRAAKGVKAKLVKIDPAKALNDFAFGPKPEAKPAKAKASKAKATEYSLGGVKFKAVDGLPFAPAADEAKPAKATKAKAVKATKAKPAPAPAPAPAATAAAVCEAAPAAAAAVDEIEKAAREVVKYAEKVGVWVDSVCRIAKVSGEYDELVKACGMEPNTAVIRAADRMHRAEIDATVAPYRPKLAGRSVSAVMADGTKAPRQSVGRVAVFGHPATGVIRALRATLGMSFADIRAVLDANGAAAIADGTIRQQMTGANTGKRGEPAPLTAAQLDAARACVAKAAAVEPVAAPVKVVTLQEVVAKAVDRFVEAKGKAKAVKAKPAAAKPVKAKPAKAKAAKPAKA